jgi:galactose mutarotase-like enzyme
LLNPVQSSSKVGLTMISLEAGAGRTSIASKGAEIKDWTVGGKPLLWLADPAVWDETAPLLFPVVGWTKDHQIHVGGEIYPLGLHGFARSREFRLVERGKDRVRLILSSDSTTRSLYPFDFNLTVDYRLSERTISVAAGVENCGTTPMPYACGLHPGFRWPFAGGAPEDYLLRFAEREDPLVPVIAPGGLISATKRRLPLEDRVLRLSPRLFENDALCFLNAASKAVRFEAPNGAAIIVETENFPHFGIWCRPGNGFLCIEEWTGTSDPEDFAGDLFAKPSMRVLPPGANQHHTACFTYEAAPC